MPGLFHALIIDLLVEASDTLWLSHHPHLPEVNNHAVLDLPDHDDPDWPSPCFVGDASGLAVWRTKARENLPASADPCDPKINNMLMTWPV